MNLKAASIPLLLTLALGLAACTADTSTTSTTTAPVTNTEPTQATAPPTVATTEVIDSESPSDETAQPSPLSGTDLLTFANGALYISQSGLTGDGSIAALSVIDGNPEVRVFQDVRDVSVEFIYELPAETIFDDFAVPGAGNGPGGTLLFDEIEVAGSLVGPESGFEVLAGGSLQDPVEGVTEFATELQRPVRWIRVTLSKPGDVAGADTASQLGFTELMGYGTQAEMPLSEAFAGAWELRPAGTEGGRTVLMWLAQEGTSLSGCVGQTNFSGTVNGSIARATGVNPADGALRAYIFVADQRGGLQGVVSESGGHFGARVGVAANISRPAPCAAQLPAPETCGSIVYVNFSVDSAQIRPESKPVLADLFARVQGEDLSTLTIEGHTSTEGTDAYNQELSEQRAQAVVEELVKRGLDSTGLNAVGKGETEPIIFPELDEAGRSINRRVEISCE